MQFNHTNPIAVMYIEVSDTCSLFVQFSLLCESLIDSGSTDICAGKNLWRKEKGILLRSNLGSYLCIFLSIYLLMIMKCICASVYLYIC